MVAISSILAISTSQTVNINKYEVISGDAKVLSNTVQNINKYIPQIKEKDLDIKQANNKTEYTQKPEITNTESREAREKAERQKKLAQAKRNVYTRNRTARSSYSSKPANISGSRTSNTYGYGYCTWYAAQKRPDLPNQLGNGGSWYNSAQRSGISTGREPKAGAVIVTGESWAGHVGYVESVNDNSITISEMNYNGWNRVSTRTISKNSAIVKGYIY